MVMQVLITQRKERVGGGVSESRRCGEPDVKPAGEGRSKRQITKTNCHTE